MLVRIKLKYYNYCINKENKMNLTIPIKNGNVARIELMRNEMRRESFYIDNCWIRNIEKGKEYLAVQIDNNSVYFYYYVVPGRLDKYSFKLQQENQIMILRYFSDFNLSVIKSAKQFQKDLKKTQVRKMIQEIRSKSKRYNILLNKFFKYFI